MNPCNGSTNPRASDTSNLNMHSHTEILDNESDRDECNWLLDNESDRDECNLLLDDDECIDCDVLMSMEESYAADMFHEQRAGCSYFSGLYSDSDG